MKRFHTLLILFSLAVFCNVAHAEYVIYLEGAQGQRCPLPEELHQRVYQELMRYQFPMSGDFFRASSDELSDLCADECAFIERKIQTIDSMLKIIFIPKTLYQVMFTTFFIQYLLDNYSSIDDFKAADDRMIKRKQQNLKSPGDDTHLEEDILEEEDLLEDLLWMKAQQQNNLCDSARRTHFQLNNDINARLEYCNHVLGIGGDFSKILDCFFEKLIPLKKRIIEQYGLGGYKECPYFNPLRLFLGDGDEYFKNNAVRAILQKAVQAEIEAESKGAFVLYRGTMGYQGCLDKIVGGENRLNYWALSYGNSLVAGSFFDLGVCPLHYILLYRIGYALCIGKKEYFDSSSFVSRLFVNRGIPARSTLVGLVSENEPSHVHISSRRLLGGAEGIIFEREGEAEEMFQNYLREYAVILKGALKKWKKRMQKPTQQKISSRMIPLPQVLPAAVSMSNTLNCPIILAPNFSVDDLMRHSSFVRRPLMPLTGRKRKRLQCDYCGKQFLSRAGFQRHDQNYCPSKQSNFFDCQEDGIPPKKRRKLC